MISNKGPKWLRKLWCFKDGHKWYTLTSNETTTVFKCFRCDKLKTIKKEVMNEHVFNKIVT